MKLIQYSHAADFLKKTLPRLEEHEAANNLILGLAFRLVDHPDFYLQPPFFATVEDNNGLVLAALMTPPHYLTLCDFGAEAADACKLLSESLIDGHWPVPGIRAPSGISALFASTWAEITGRTYMRSQSMRVYELRKVIPPHRPARGRMLQAGPGDLELVAQWQDEFNREALPQVNPDDPRRISEMKIRNKEMYFWEDGQPVCMAAATRPTRHGIVIGSVYTPPAARRRGYGSSLVSELSQLQLDRGYQFTSLFTDLANPTSNKIYQDVGYVPLGDFQEYHFKHQD